MKPIISVFAFVSLATMAACNNSALKEKDQALQAQQHTIDSMNTELAKKKVIDSMNEVMSMQYVVPSTATVITQPAAAASATRRATKRNYAGHARNSNAVAQAPAEQQAPATKHKKGWSAKAKGAIIGAGTGAATGAIINKRNRAAGAVIGTVIGAATGTGVGAIIDKKNGR